MPSLNHGAVQANLIVEFAKHREFRVASELTLNIDGKSFTPDLSIYVRQPIDWRHDQVRATQPPLLAVEIFSPQQGSQGVMDKVDVYFQFGVKSCWVISPPVHAVRILTADGHEESYTEGVIKDPVTGLTADLSVVFS